MALKRLEIDGYGQLELNAVAFPRDGRIEAQCKLDEVDFDSIPAENGMLLAVDNITRRIKLPVEGGIFPIALNYSTEHMYDERKPGLKHFKTGKEDFLPRMGYLSVGDKFTTNCLSYDTDEFADEAALKEGLLREAREEAPIYGGICENGSIKLSATQPTEGPVLLVILDYTMPDGQYAVKLHCIKA